MAQHDYLTDLTVLQPLHFLMAAYSGNKRQEKEQPISLQLSTGSSCSPGLPTGLEQARNVSVHRRLAQNAVA